MVEELKLNQPNQKLLHSNNLLLLKLRPRHSPHRRRHNSLLLSSSLNLTQPVMIPATTTELTITTEARTLMLALERVMLAVSLRDQPSNEPRQIACNARTLQICKSKH